MKVAATTGAVIAALTVGALATPSFADPYRAYAADTCQAQKHENGTAGAIIGGIAGALLGSNLASHNGGRAGGAAIGGVAGAVIGNSIGRDSAGNCRYGQTYAAPAYSQGYGATYSAPVYSQGYYSPAYVEPVYSQGYAYGYERPAYRYEGRYVVRDGDDRRRGD